MLSGKTIAVVVPCHNEETQIGGVIETMPEYVDAIIVVDDASPDTTSAVTQGYADNDKRVVLITQEVNQGVGAAIVTGYRKSLEMNMGVIAVMAGDGQMPPDELAGICQPVIDGKADYTKANRLASGEAWDLIPRKRYLGNAMLTFLTKIASGYYHVTDSQTGYTAISHSMLSKMQLDKMYPRYGYPNDMLVKLNVLRARVIDIPSHPVYNVGEQSGLKINKVLFTMSFLLFKLFWWRLATLYIVRDFHPLVLFYTLGFFLMNLGLVAGIVIGVLAFAIDLDISAATAVLVSLAFQAGLLLTLFGMLFDFEHNKSLNSGL